MKQILCLALLVVLLQSGHGQDPLLDAVVPVTDPPMTQAQLALNAMCAQKCMTELCYLADETDCRNFITCQRDIKQRYHGTLQMCAFGTMWAGLQTQKKITCDVPSNVVCLIDYCAGRNLGDKFDHYDGNCMTYWTCESKGPVPRCCNAGYYYDSQTNQCLMNTPLRNCHDVCPFKTDACTVNQQATAFFDDGNCKTYWDCEDNTPHPVCCTRPGEGYNPANGTCVQTGCMDTCPPEYKPDICLQPGVETYAIHDGSCRTYMKCNRVDGDERWCCPSNNVYDPVNGCVPRTPDMNVLCDDYCPRFYNEWCPLKADPTDASMYLSINFGAEMRMPCAPGTLFDLQKCGCAVPVKGAPDNSCNMEIDVIFDMPSMIRSGSQRNVDIIRIGQAEGSTMLNGRMPWRFNGRLINRIPFAQQPFDKVYISLIFLPERANSPEERARKQILLSNCMNLELGGPSLEVALQNGRLSTSLVTALPTGPVQAISSVPYQEDQWQVLTVMYDGSNLEMALEGQGTPAVDRQALSGSVTVAAEGLDFGGCAINRGGERNDGFVGSMAKLSFSKCLKQKWVDDFNAIIQPNVAIP